VVKTDPNYTDLCISANENYCDYCCLSDLGICSHDISVCDPILERKVDELYSALYVMAAAIVGKFLHLTFIGFPALIMAFQICISNKYCPQYF
jgi:hypothetical protein